MMKEKLAELKSAVEEQLKSGKGDAKTLKLKELLDKLVPDDLNKEVIETLNEKMTELLAINNKIANKELDLDELINLIAQKETEQNNVLNMISLALESQKESNIENAKEHNRLLASVGEKLDKVVELSGKEVKTPPDRTNEVVEAIKSIDVKPEVKIEQKEFSLKGITQVLTELWNAIVDFGKTNVFQAKVENTRQKPLYTHILDKDGKIINNPVGPGGSAPAYHTGVKDANGNEAYLKLNASGELEVDANFTGTVDLGNVGLLDSADVRIDPATSAKQLPDGHAVAVNNLPTDYPLPAGQITTLTPPAAITGFATSAKQLPDGHNVAVSNMIAAVETGLSTSANQLLQVQSALTPTTYNIAMTNADTEYSQALPANTKKFTLQCRTAFDIRFAFATGKVATPNEPYMTLKSGAVYFEDNLNLTSKTLYVACGSASKSAEVICWS